MAHILELPGFEPGGMRQGDAPVAFYKRKNCSLLRYRIAN